ncbi:TetR family transcriptional regulator [Variovorax dokdonensis]|uniref:TetR family transcriptional regulator n=1 Tax=Variovorax dokdonensis TaxID=344883 RepID=A0ABT7NEH8_9BURK|nr:TetR/AcrR family transcriptional regulator [Variovorax dokdonensis]MDM0046353.1 TetR family transcriptional regulator [Variovorax dokdonensis]
MALNPVSGRRPRKATALKLREGDATLTRERILDAAFRRLVTEGYAALSVREIAKDAGVNHALINYHFRSKDQLVIEVLDAANERLLARQASMYASKESLAQKWASARRFYEEDLKSGFVRLQAELWAASLANEALREKFLPRLLAWKKLVLVGVREAIAALEANGTPLPPPLTPEVIACWISEFWLGMEFTDLLGVAEEQAQHHAALDGVQWLLESLDAKAARASHAAPRSRRRA